MILSEKIRNRKSGIFLYGLTPPKQGTSKEKLKEISERHIQRLQSLALDGLVLYDIQDEISRTEVQRPFPYLETMDASYYCDNYLASLEIPKIIYRSVGKYQKRELSHFLTNASARNHLTVFVGAPSQYEKVNLSLKDAYNMKETSSSSVLLGGVTIPERHQKNNEEHLKIFRKISLGCTYFISQGIYDVKSSLNLLSDYYYYGKEHNIPLAPVIFTLTPCGSLKTLQFMKWLGISFPRWLENDLHHASDILEKSMEHCQQTWRELKSFADAKNIPIGCNVESVAIKKAEIEASLELLKTIQRIP